MKNATLRLFLIFVLLLIQTTALSQNEKNFADAKFWVKGGENENQSNFGVDLKKTSPDIHLNYNAPIDLKSDKKLRKQRNLITKSSSLFVVFKSFTPTENPLIELERGVFKVNLSTHKLKCNEELRLNKGNPEKGLIVNYLYNKGSLSGKRNGNLSFDDSFMEGEESQTQIFELIYIPYYINENEKSKFETYLSLKYGISLSQETDYYSSDGIKIWDAKHNDGFNNKVTGIGKDNYFQLDQKQSKNSLNQELSIGLGKIMNTNDENNFELKDKEFLIWGDNGGSMNFEKNESSKNRRIKRVWKVASTSDSTSNFVTQIKIDKKFLSSSETSDNDEDIIWLAVSNASSSQFDYQNAKYYKGIINNTNDLIFDNVEFNSTSDHLFTIVKGKEADLTLEILTTNEVNQNSDVKESLANQIIIYPNPIDVTKKFNIQFRLQDSSDVIIRISDTNGKIIKTRNAGILKDEIIEENISTAGTYLIMISVDGKIETRKLIVK